MTGAAHRGPWAALVTSFVVGVTLLTAVRGEAAFTEITDTGLPAVSNGAAVWGDYDGDGDLDVLVVGALVSKIFRRGQTVPPFTDIGAPLVPLDMAAAAWGDYDGDGDLDIVVTGQDAGNNPVSKIYRAINPTTFVDAGITLTGLSRGAVAWGDYDNDGDLDILLSGRTTTTPFTVVYKNSGGPTPTFIAVSNLIGVEESSVAWGDYDKDGDLDILLTGLDGSSTPITRIYRNSGPFVSPTFSDIAAGLTGAWLGSCSWWDYDNDGDLDILLTGTTSASGASSGGIAKIYRSSGGTSPAFTDISAATFGVSRSAAAWADYDNDGDLDMLLCGGSTAGFRITRLYTSSGGVAPTFTSVQLPALVSLGSVEWGDYNLDGALDYLITGDTGSGNVTRLFAGDSPADVAPAAPGGLNAIVVSGRQVTFSWNAATDAETPAAALNYNLRVGTTPHASNVVSVMSDTATGRRFLPAPGNCGPLRSMKVTLPAYGTYYWSVQSVDGAFVGSRFASERTMSVQGFTDIGAGLPGVEGAALAWGDYDNDGDLDLAMAGLTLGISVARIYRNTGSVFSDIGAGLPGIKFGAVAWGDIDADGDLDLAVAGDSSGLACTRLFRNTPTGFAGVAAGLTPVTGAALAWGDFDNDGDLDLALAGTNPSMTNVTQIWRNSGGAFADVGAGLPGITSGALAWADYDNDGDLDLVLSSSGATRLFRNTGGVFTDATAGLPQAGAVAWGDYDQDGDLDLLFNSGGVYRNAGGSFTNIGAGLQSFLTAPVAWGDYDNDGDLDVAIAGSSTSIIVTRIYRNSAGVFADVGAGLPGVSSGAVVWGDYDGDGDLDIALAGSDGFSGVARIYRNDGGIANTRPSAPTGLSVTFEDTTATFHWAAASDGQTLPAGLSYNLRIGTTPGGGEVVPPMAHASTGLRRVAQLGNAQQNLRWSVPRSHLPPGPFYWTVQAIDNDYAGSAFATAVVTGVETEPSAGTFVLCASGPNPFHSHARVVYSLPRAARVEIRVYDLTGRWVRTVFQGQRPAGTYEARWTGDDSRGKRAGPGIYLFRLTAGGIACGTKMVKVE